MSDKRWEKSWSEYVWKSWRKSPGTWDWDAQHCVYVMTVPFSKMEYIGETTRKVFTRWRGHIRKLKTGTQQLYATMRNVGIFRSVITPLVCWDFVTEKVERLREEGKHIWNRTASLNTRGRQEGGEIRKVGGGSTVLFGQRRRYRPVKQLREKWRTGARVEIEGE